MKVVKNFFFVLLCVCTSDKYTVGQTYFPIPEANVFWNITWSDDGCFQSGVPDGTYSYYTSGDTILNSISYRKIIRTGLNFPACFPPTSNNSNGYVGCFRNDTLNKIVYWIQTGDTVEKQLYNFNLYVNDTVRGDIAINCNDAIVTSIDSILINGYFHKQYHVAGTLCSGVLIEGIGNSLGFIEPMQTFEGGGLLNCVNLNNQTIYPNSATVCNLINDLPEILTSCISIDRDGFKIYIHLCNDFIFQDDFNIRLYDINGRLLFQSMERFLFFTLEVNTNNIYLIIIKNNNRQFSFRE